MFVREFRGQGNAPGAAVQLCTLSWLGFGPDEVASAPTAAVARLAEWLGTVLAGSTTAWNRPAQQAARRLAATRRCRAARHRPGRPRRGGRRCPRLLSLIHISEPTRLGMISYAVFCLKKKKNQPISVFKVIVRHLNKSNTQKISTKT